MARLVGPLMSIDASGSVAGSLTFAKWKGRSYVRQLVIPSNPKTPGQISNRVMFGFLGTAWAALADNAKASWSDLADQRKVSTFNAFVKSNQDGWKNFLAPTQAYPATRPTWTHASLITSVVGAVGQASVNVAQADDEDAWGIMIFRSKTTGFTPAKSDIVGCLVVLQDSAATFVDSPLAAGTYYYKVQGFSRNGSKGTMSAQTAATVT